MPGLQVLQAPERASRCVAMTRWHANGHRSRCSADRHICRGEPVPGGRRCALSSIAAGNIIDGTRSARGRRRLGVSKLFGERCVDAPNPRAADAAAAPMSAARTRSHRRAQLEGLGALRLRDCRRLPDMGSNARQPRTFTLRLRAASPAWRPRRRARATRVAPLRPRRR
jgi:hypothetical protein